MNHLFRTWRFAMLTAILISFLSPPNLKAQSTPQTNNFCIYLSNSISSPDNTGILFWGIEPGWLEYYHHPTDIYVANNCRTFCLSSCIRPDLSAVSGPVPYAPTPYFYYEITGPGGFFLDNADVYANGGCFTLPTTPGTYTFTRPYSGSAVNFIVTGAATAPPLNILPFPNTCSLSEFQALIPTYIQNIGYYPAYEILIDGLPMSDFASLCPGTYDISVTGTDLCGNTSSDEGTFTIIPASGNFSTTVNCGEVTFTPSFTCTSQIANYDWDYGDGSTDYNTSAGTTHTYTLPGTYTVTLTADAPVSPSCLNDVVVFQDIVIAPPVAAFAANTNCNLIASITPNYTCPDLISSVLWDFGDGSTSTAFNPGSHTYTTPGSYVITLTYIYNSFSSGFITQIVTHTVYAGTAAPATVTGPASSCGSPLTYTVSGGTITGTPTISPSSAATITAGSTPGQYIVTVLNNAVPFIITFPYTDESGCEGTITQNVAACCTQNDVPLVITGVTYSCSLTGNTYTVPNTPGTMYSWSINPVTAGTITAGAGTNNIAITWVNQNVSAVVTVTSTDENGCTQTGEIRVNPCCLPIEELQTGPNVVNTSAASATALSAYLGVWPGTTAGTTSLTGVFIYVYHDLTINTNFTFDNCAIYVAPGKRITVSPGVTANWNDGIVREMCPEMWAGIFANNATANISANRTIFRQAISALWSQNGGNIDLYQCQLRNNYTGLTVQNYPLAVMHPVTVARCTFETTGALLSPHTGKQSHRAIYISKVGDITIGATPAADANIIRKSDFGIYVQNSNATIINNNFSNIQPTALSPVTTAVCDMGTAICDANNATTVQSLNVGQYISPSLSYPNNYTNCLKGIMTVGRMNENLQANRMTGVNSGIEILNNTKSNIRVFNYNTFKDFSSGIYLFNIAESDIFMANNEMNLSSPTSVGNFGITLSNPMATYFKAQIEFNRINHIVNGISIFNSIGMDGFTGPVDINLVDNHIQFTQLGTPTTGSTEHNAIRIENCAAIMAKQNFITRPNYATTLVSSANVGYLRGVKISNAQLIALQTNYIYGMGEGVRSYGSCSNNFYMCNYFAKPYYAFNFEGPTGTADIGPQLPGNNPQGNRYGFPTGAYSDHAVSGFDLVGRIFPTVDWWFNGGSMTNALTGLATGSTYGALTTEDQPTSISDSLACDVNRLFVLPDPFGGQAREQFIGNMTGEKEFDENGYEYNMYDKLRAYHVLNQNQHWLSTGTAGDATYQDFYAESQGNNVGKFDTIAQSFAADTLPLAKSLNDGLNPDTQFERYIQRVNEIYFTYLTDSTMSTEDSLELREIAYLNGTLGGPGVYHARAILRLYPEDVNGGATRSFIFTEPQEQVATSTATIYPNPNTGQFYLKLNDGAANAAYTVSITDVQGRTVYTDSFMYQGQPRMMQWQAASGVYLLTLRDNTGQPVQYEKVIVNK